MKIASYNVENLFQRAAALNSSNWEVGRPALEDYVRLSELVQKDVYSDEIKLEMRAIIDRHEGLSTKGLSKYIRLRESREKFFYKNKIPYTIIPNGRADWLGWFELVTEPVNEVAIKNTARIINIVNADILCVIEAENRTGLENFNSNIISKVSNFKYDQIMLIDGVDDRGIDVGIMLKEGYKLLDIKTHIFDKDNEGIIFSRDCPEYLVETPNGNTILILINHFKSKTKGSEGKRMRQARRVREIYEQRIKEGIKNIVVLGDLNDFPDEATLAPLLSEGSDLVDVVSLPNYITDGIFQTYWGDSNISKLDYILLSPDLLTKVQDAGIEKLGVWAGKNGDKLPHLPEIKSRVDSASDHAALWVKIDLN